MGESALGKWTDWLRFQYNRCRVPQWHSRRIAALRRERRPVRVVFMAMSVAMWRYQHLLEAMRTDSRFDCSVVLSPSISYNREQQERDLEAMRGHFNRCSVPFVDMDFDAPADVKSLIDPDIVFYPQPYEHLLIPPHDCLNFYDRLVCYYPYGFWTSTGKWSYDFHFHNLAWRQYYSTPMHLAEAQKVARNHGANVRVVGYPNADDFLASTHNDPWKRIEGSPRRKRVVWAPHYAIADEFGLAARSNFLWMAEPMLRLAQERDHELQVAFKPHPRLLTELYAHPDWGRERTDNYYHQWQTLDNGQLETGGFVDLFMTSDAMVHDSGSFVVEYHYSQRPVMFVSQDLDALLATQSEFGRDAYRHSYIGRTWDDIAAFIDGVVLGGNDPMAPGRKRFFDECLLPPGGKTVAQNTLDDIINSIYGDESD